MMLELIPLAGVGIAVNTFEGRMDTVPIRQDQTFQEAHLRTGLFALYHYSCAVASAGYILYEAFLK